MKYKTMLLGTAAPLPRRSSVARRRSAASRSSPVTEGDDIVGVVTGQKGPEAGVWVIAETKDLPTKYTKIVVTDDQGRFAMPDLPKANYSVWVRGYGLVDSQKMQATPGDTLNLRAGREASPKEAAEIYPAMYWFSLLKVPAAERVSARAGAEPAAVAEHDQERRLPVVPRARHAGHAQGAGALHEDGQGQLARGLAQRLRAGSAQALMARDISRLDGERAIANFADWTDRIAKGELPFDKPRAAARASSATS